MRFSLFFLLCFNTLAVYGQQNIPIGQWRSHVSYGNGIRLAEVKNKVYCATNTGLYSIGETDNSIQALSRVQGFSDIFIKNIYYAKATDMLFIAYRNANMDILQGSRITNITDLVGSNTSGLSEINDFYAFGDTMFITTSTGLSEYRMKKMEFGDSPSLYDKAGNPIPLNSVTVDEPYIYVSSPNGVYRDRRNAPVLFFNADMISKDSCGSLVSFAGKIWGDFKGDTLKYWDGSRWNKYNLPQYGRINSLEVDQGKLVIAMFGAVVILSPDLSYQVTTSNQQNYAILAGDRRIWLAKNDFGCVRLEPQGGLSFLKPIGPISNQITYLYGWRDEIWAGTGGVTDQGSSRYLNVGFNQFKNGEWKAFAPSGIPFEVRDPWRIVKDTIEGHVWVGSLDTGLAEMADDKILRIYSANNSSLQTNLYDKRPGYSYAQISGLSFDQSGNLWVANYRAPKPLSVKTLKGQWHAFSLGTDVEPVSALADDFGNVWCIMRGGGIALYNPGRSLDDNSDDMLKQLTSGTGQGNLPDKQVNAIAKDKLGQIWVGTNDGVAVFADPGSAFSNRYAFDAQRIWVKSGGSSAPLLLGQSVTCIAVDGGNRKWIGTRNGVWLTNPDGDRILANFNSSNAPFTNNIIRSIAINGKTGEVFISTEEGVLSYRSTATEGGDKNGDVYAWPNPVRPGYSGPIAISGLVNNAHVKITDITGNLVYETTAEGGQAIWYGKNFSGQDAHSGVYMVFSTNDEGSETIVTKILIVR